LNVNVQSVLFDKVFVPDRPPKSGVKKMRGEGGTVTAEAAAKVVKKNK
jgi:hypothetical protein